MPTPLRVLLIHTGPAQRLLVAGAPPLPTTAPTVHAQLLTQTDNRVFNQVQAETHSPLAPFALGVSLTGSSSATPPLPGMASTRPSPNASGANCSSVRTINPSARIGNTS